MQQACTIIQGAAHEDANIIFGAVLDEKMKDAVKITVIATGFKEADMHRNRHHENYDPVIISREMSRSSRDVAQEYSRQVSRQVSLDSFGERQPMAGPEPIFEPERAFEPDPAPVGFLESAQSESHGAEVISLDAMRSGAPNYQAEDLDVPAFLRKRNEVM